MCLCLGVESLLFLHLGIAGLHEAWAAVSMYERTSFGQQPAAFAVHEKPLGAESTIIGILEILGRDLFASEMLTDICVVCFYFAHR